MFLPGQSPRGALSYNKDASGIQGSYLTGGVNTTVANNIYTLPAMEANGKLPGLFTVASGKQVQFTKGNLWCNTTANPVEWHLESSQTAYPSSWNTSHVGHFYLSKTASVSYAKEYSDGGASAGDAFFFGEGNAFTVEDQSGLYALSKDEWSYLLNYDPEESDFKTDGNVRQDCWQGIP